MPEFRIKFFVLVIACHHPSIFNPEGVVEILIQGMFGNFNGPALQVFSVEQLDPLFFLSGCLSGFFLLSTWIAGNK